MCRLYGCFVHAASSGDPFVHGRGRSKNAGCECFAAETDRAFDRHFGGGIGGQFDRFDQLRWFTGAPWGQNAYQR